MVEEYTLNVDTQHMRDHNAVTCKAAEALRRHPQEMIPLMDRVVSAIADEQFNQEGHLTRDQLTFRVRPFHLAKVSSMRDLNPKGIYLRTMTRADLPHTDIDQLVATKGLIIRTSNIIPDPKQGFFRCEVCRATATSNIDRGTITEPTVCPNCQMQHSMKIVHNRGIYTDKQVVKLQETPDCVPDGQTPHTVSVYVYNSLVDTCRPGDRVEVTGIFRAAPNRPSPGRSEQLAQFRTFLDVIHMRKTESRRVDTDPNDLDPGEYANTVADADATAEMNARREERMRAIAAQPDLYDRLARSLAPSIYEWGT